ncbi:MAG: rhodanese-like domain-containing protein [Cycloclasticus sp.]
MDIYFEFVSNHSLLFIALVVIVIFLVQSLFSDLTRKYKLVTVAEAIDLINREEAVIVDTRNQAEFDSGHITDAILIPLPEIKESDEKLKKYEGKPLLFYCKTGARSDEACKILNKQGINNIYALNGGVQSWQEADMPLVKK